MRSSSILPSALLALLAVCTGCADVCQPCKVIHTNPSWMCGSGLQCVENRCVRDQGNLPGECCGQGAECNFEGFCANDKQCQRYDGNLEGEHCSEDGAQCNEAFLCVYQTCETLPIYPPVREFTQQEGEAFSLDPDTLIILPENPSSTDETAGRVLREQIAASCGVDLTVRSYMEGDPPANAIVIGTPAANPAVQALLSAGSLEIPDDGPAPAENYALRIEASNILVAGRGGPGSLYGAQALKQYIREVIPRVPSSELPPVTVRDYPDTEQRAFKIIFVHYYFPYPQVQQGNTDGYKFMDIPFSLDTAYAYLHIMSELRFNMAILKMGDIVAWQSLPQPENTAITVQDYLDLVREANDYGLETVPLINGSSAHNGWIATVDEPIEYTEEYAVSHYEEHLAVYLGVVEEIIQAYDGVQPLRYFHAGMDEDFTFGSRPLDYHLQWVDAAYSLITSHNVKMIVWFDCWACNQHFINEGQNYPNMHVAVWDYFTPVSDFARTKIGQVLERGLEVSLALWGNGTPEDLAWWSSLQDPGQRGFIGLNWVNGTMCREPTSQVFEETVNVYMRKCSDLFWNAAHIQ